jgi:hypothetical protein
MANGRYVLYTEDGGEEEKESNGNGKECGNYKYSSVWHVEKKCMVDATINGVDDPCVATVTTCRRVLLLRRRKLPSSAAAASNIGCDKRTSSLGMLAASNAPKSMHSGCRE